MKRVPGWVKVIGSLLLFLGVVILITPSGRGRENHRRSLCQANLKLITMACRQYLSDADDHFPPVSRSINKSWSNLLSPYLEDHASFQCTEGFKPNDERQIDYFYNARLAGFSHPKSPDEVILFGDGQDNASPDAYFTELPSQWKGLGPSPGRRHMDGANYAFADGHVKWLLPTKITESKSKYVDYFYTFAVHK